ncbi:hypothetical protein [Candidatus Tisiphia endosymbiont of Mystacides longicornis]|uniref:hypothetical protein n=1 Tax=Candidatus Tisiphia endosymbiont of Mystacides longicornis TaxID=3139330 RepID=UPI003CCAF896
MYKKFILTKKLDKVMQFCCKYTLQQNINFLPFQLVNSIDTDPVAAPKQNHYTCHIIKPNGTKLIIQTLEPKTIIQTFLCCN